MLMHCPSFLDLMSAEVVVPSCFGKPCPTQLLCGVLYFLEQQLLQQEISVGILHGHMGCILHRQWKCLCDGLLGVAKSQLKTDSLVLTGEEGDICGPVTQRMLVVRKQNEARAGGSCPFPYMLFARSVLLHALLGLVQS